MLDACLSGICFQCRIIGTMALHEDANALGVGLCAFYLWIDGTVLDAYVKGKARGLHFIFYLSDLYPEGYNW